MEQALKEIRSGGRDLAKGQCFGLQATGWQRVRRRWVRCRRPAWPRTCALCGGEMVPLLTCPHSPDCAACSARSISPMQRKKQGAA